MSGRMGRELVDIHPVLLILYVQCRGLEFTSKFELAELIVIIH